MSALQNILDKPYGTRTPLEQCISDAVTLEDMRDGDNTEQEKAANDLLWFRNVEDAVRRHFATTQIPTSMLRPTEKRLLDLLGVSSI